MTCIEELRARRRLYSCMEQRARRMLLDERKGVKRNALLSSDSGASF